MKKIMSLAVILVSVSTFAINEDSTWSQIQAELKVNAKLRVSGTTVFVGRPLSAFDTCIDGENFVSTKKFPIYKQVRVSRSQDNDGDRDGWTNVKVGEEYISYPITYTSYKDVCNNRDKNCKKVSYTVEQETVKEVVISKFVRSSGSRRNGSDTDVYAVLFTKSFEIPTCN